MTNLWYILCSLCIISNVFAARVSTWDSCGCHWASWESWSQCSKTCGGGTQDRDRRVWIRKVPGCDKFENCATPDSSWENRVCNTICYNGGSFRQLYSIYGTCHCPRGKKGSCCEQTVTCGQPSSISHGSYTGNDFTYNNRVQYTCDTNYNMTDPTTVTRTCAENGYWTGSAPLCMFATSCESNPCNNSAQCANLLGDYRCNCLSGWTGKNCDVDIQPPVVIGCPHDRHILTTTMTNKQTWNEPNITDPHGKDVNISKNYQNSNFEFPWGVFTIQYYAVKPSNGLKVECLFNISVKPNPCKKMVPPIHGILVCNSWRKDFAQVCKFLCMANYTLPPGYKTEDMYNCGATGNWLPPNPVTQCVSDKLFPMTTSGTSSKSFGACSSPEDRRDISELYIGALQKSSLNALCTNHIADCKPEHVDISC